MPHVNSMFSRLGGVHYVSFCWLLSCVWGGLSLSLVRVLCVMLERLYRDGLCVGRGAHGALTARRATVRCALSSIVYVSRFLSWVVSGGRARRAHTPHSQRECASAHSEPLCAVPMAVPVSSVGAAHERRLPVPRGEHHCTSSSHTHATVRYIRARTRALKKPRHRRHTHTRTHAHHTHSHSRRPVAATQPRFRERAPMKPTPSGDAPLRPS